jgi:hypothetical protein
MPMIPSLVQVFPTRIRGAIMVVDWSPEPARSRPEETCPDEDLVSQPIFGCAWSFAEMQMQIGLWKPLSDCLPCSKLA